MDSSSPQQGEPLAAVRRVDYAGEGLVEADVAATPHLQAQDWIEHAVAAARERDDVPEPTALSVATVDAAGGANVRTVLMRFFDERGPGFVTNLESTKSVEIAAQPRIAASLTWPSLYRSIRFRGAAHLIEREEVTRYFDSRPYGSRLSAWASDQSRPAADRAALDAAWQAALARFPDTGERRRARARLLGRVAHRLRRGRVLGGAVQPPARPHRLHPRRRLGRRPRRPRRVDPLTPPALDPGPPAPGPPAPDTGTGQPDVGLPCLILGGGGGRD